MTARLAAKDAALGRLLERIARDHAPAALASSLSVEDMVLTDAILRERLGIEIFTIDTGRLHGDTFALVDRIAQRYDYRVQVFRPDLEAVQRYVTAHGRNAFYEGVELRQQCCAIRKVEPLRRALAGKRAWLTGMRRAQSATRAALLEREFDPVHGIEKFSPLVEWSEGDVWSYARAHDVPYNPLHDQGYRSIGCAPCTRPVAAGEDVRAGRWWWEQSGARECGLHVGADGHLVSARKAA